MTEYRLLAIDPDKFVKAEDYDYLMAIYQYLGEVKLPIVGEIHNAVYVLNDFNMDVYKVGERKQSFLPIFVKYD